MISKQTQGPVLATYGRVKFNSLAAKVGGKGLGSPQKPV
jgi:hypothetical protein